MQAALAEHSFTEIECVNASSSFLNRSGHDVSKIGLAVSKGCTERRDVTPTRRDASVPKTNVLPENII